MQEIFCFNFLGKLIFILYFYICVKKEENEDKEKWTDDKNFFACCENENWRDYKNEEANC